MATVTAVKVVAKDDFSVPNKTLQFQEVRCFEPKIAETGTSNQANPCILCVSNRFGVSFIVIHGALHVVESRSLLVDADLPPSVKTGVCAIGLSCDESLLAVATGSDVSIYETNSFILQPTTSAPKCHFLVSKSGASTHQIAWNPAESKLIAGLGSDGALAIIKILDNWSIELATHTDSSFKCISWSPKGKQLSVGGSKSIVQLKTDLKKAKEVALVQGQTAVSIFWLSNTQFLLAMVPTDSNQSELKIMLLTVDKTEAVYHDYGDIFLSDDLSQPLVTTKVLAEWKLHIFGSSTSSDIIVASYDHGASNADVVVQEIEDQFRPAAPLDHFCTGLGLYLGNQDPVTIEGEELHSTPILIVLTQKGTLKLFKVANQGFESIFKPTPEPLKPGVIASKLPPAYSAPKSESSVTQPTPVTQPFPSSLPTFSFGSTSALGGSSPFLSGATVSTPKSLFGDSAQKSVSSVPVVSSPAATPSSALFPIQAAAATSVAKTPAQIPEVGTNGASQAGGDTFASPSRRNEDFKAEHRKQKLMIVLEAMKQFEKRFKAHKKSYPRPSFCQIEAAKYDQWLETDFVSDMHMLIDFAKDIQETTDGQSEEVNMLHITMQQLFTKVEHACVVAVKTADPDYLSSLKALPIDSVSLAKLVHLEKLHAGFGNRLKECARYFSMKEKGNRPMDRTATSEIIYLAIDRHSKVLENLRQKIDVLRRRFEVIQSSNAGRLPSDSVISLDDLLSGVSRLQLKSRDRKSEVSGTRSSLNSATITSVSNYNRTTVDALRRWAEQPLVTHVKVTRGIDPSTCYPKVTKIRPAKDAEYPALVTSKAQSSNVAVSSSSAPAKGQSLSAFVSTVTPELSEVSGKANTVTFPAAQTKSPFGASSVLGNAPVFNTSMSTPNPENISSGIVKSSVPKAASAVGFGVTSSLASSGATSSIFGSASFASPIFGSSKASVGTSQPSSSSGLVTPPSSTTVFGSSLSPSLLQSGDSTIPKSVATGVRSDSIILSSPNATESPKPPMTSIFTLKSANANASSAAALTSAASAPVFSFGPATQGSLFGVTQSKAPTSVTETSGSVSTLSSLGSTVPSASGAAANVLFTKPMFGVSTTAALGTTSSLLLSNTTKPFEVAKAPVTVLSSGISVPSPTAISSSSPVLKAALSATPTGEKVPSVGIGSSIATVKPLASVTPSKSTTQPGATVGTSALTSSVVSAIGAPASETSLSLSFPNSITVSPATVTSTSSTGIGSTAASSTSSLFGSVAATTTSSIFAPTAAESTTPSLFGAIGSTNTNNVLGGTVTAAASLPLFGATNTVTTTPSLPDSTTSVTVPSSVAASTPSTTTSSLFGAVPTTKSSLFGTAATGTSSLFGNSAPVTSVFGSPTTATTSSLFGSTPKTAASVFGSTAVTVTPMVAATTTVTTPLFGATATTSAPSLFGSATPPTTSSLFGSPAVTSTPSAFGSVSTGSTPSLFGSPNTSASSIFGATTTAATPSVTSSTTTQPLFGSTGAAAPSIFGSTAAQSPAASTFGSTFGSSNAPQVTQSSSSLFGSSSNPVAGFGSLSFGSGDGSSTQSKPAGAFGSAPFGAISSSDTKDGKPPSGLFSSVLGAGSPTASQGSTSAFGGGSGFGSPAFGSASALKPSALSATTNIFGGGSSSTSVFGGTQSAGKEGSAFGGSPFGSSGYGASQQASPFGGAQQSVFGASPSAFGGTSAQSPAFGAKPAFGSSTQPAFGASATPAPAFGSAPVFGGSPAFGGGAVFGGMSTFGSSGTSSSVGAGSIFGGSATQQASGFGSLAAASPSPNTGSVFGGGSQQSTFGSFGSFGNQTNPAQSPSGFGGGSTFGAFGQTQQPTQQQATPAFGGSSFSSWR